MGSRKSYWPARWAEKHGAIYYRPRKEERSLWDSKSWFRLGETEAEAWATWYQRLQAPTGKPKTIGELMDRYCAEELPNRAPRTQVDYRKHLELLRVAFGHMHPRDLEPWQVYEYRAERPRVLGNREVSTLSAVFTFAVKIGSVKRNLVREVVRNEERPRDRYVEDHELEAFLKVAPPLIASYVRLKRILGIRQAQMLDLKRSDWDGKRLKVPAAKGGRVNIYHGRGLKKAIEQALAVRHGRSTRSVYLFSTRAGTKYTGDGFRCLWQYAMAKYLKAAPEGEIRESFTEHDLRAKVGSDSETEQEAQQRLGHQDAKTTRRVYRRKPQLVPVLKVKGGKQ